MSSASMMNYKCGQLTTPLSYHKFHFKPPSRKLWGKETNEQDNYHDNWNSYRSNDKEIWDNIQSPQFIDLCNIPESGDSFFDKGPIVSTPIPKTEKNSVSATIGDNTLICSLNNISLSNTQLDVTLTNVKQEQPETVNNVIIKETSGKNSDGHVTHATHFKQKNANNREKQNNVEKRHCTKVKPFGFDLREKYKQENKQERLNKFTEGDNKLKVFKAKPVPKFIKAPLLAASCNPKEENANKLGISEKPAKKSNEIWKRAGFQPCPSKKVPERPKTPRLQTAIRALQRKRFDEALKEKEKQREEIRQREALLEKQKEERDIKLLRQQTVHKAQPIRKYLSGLQEIQKRPLTDPITPILYKRRRRV